VPKPPTSAGGYSQTKNPILKKSPVTFLMRILKKRMALLAVAFLE
jgi:hypothetical protein